MNKDLALDTLLNEVKSLIGEIIHNQLMDIDFYKKIVRLFWYKSIIGQVSYILRKEYNLMGRKFEIRSYYIQLQHIGEVNG